MQFTDLKAQYAALKPAIDARIQRVLDHGQYIMGPEIGELETALAAFTGSKHCITVASGTEALLIALMANGMNPGVEAITTPLTFPATAEMIVLVGATSIALTRRGSQVQILFRLPEKQRGIAVLRFPFLFVQIREQHSPHYFLHHFSENIFTIKPMRYTGNGS